jgi:hypothetical protein
MQRIEKARGFPLAFFVSDNKPFFLDQAEGYVKVLEKSTSPLATMRGVLNIVLRATRQAETG